MRDFRKESTTKKRSGSFKRETREISKRFCRFCRGKGTDIDYKDINRLQRFITDKGRILSRRISGNCDKHQRKINESIKRARFLALLPYIKITNASTTSSRY